jgi:hypothetical protein
MTILICTRPPLYSENRLAVSLEVGLIDREREEITGIDVFVD